LLDDPGDRSTVGWIRDWLPAEYLADAQRRHAHPLQCSRAIDADIGSAVLFASAMSCGEP
jgi:hypothetical protein